MVPPVGQLDKVKGPTRHGSRASRRLMVLAARDAKLTRNSTESSRQGRRPPRQPFAAAH